MIRERVLYSNGGISAKAKCRGARDHRTRCSLPRPLSPPPSQRALLRVLTCHATLSWQAGELGEALTARLVTPLLRLLAHCTTGAHPALLDAAAALIAAAPLS